MATRAGRGNNPSFGSLPAFEKARLALLASEEKGALSSGLWCSTYHRLPDKTQLSALGMDALGEGWLPAEPLISPATRVVAIGSWGVWRG
jgi:hypothetical protein